MSSKLLVLEIANMAKIDVSLVFTIKALMGNSSAPNPIFTLLGGSEEALEIINSVTWAKLQWLSGIM